MEVGRGSWRGFAARAAASWLRKHGPTQTPPRRAAPRAVLAVLRASSAPRAASALAIPGGSPLATVIEVAFAMGFHE
jgi:hypothetical protein